MSEHATPRGGVKMDDILKMLDEFYNYDGEEECIDKEHGRLVLYRFDAYHDVKVYEDGYEEKYYIGD